IRAKLGPDAVVVNVRPLPADGLAKLWKSPRIEVLAYKPDASSSSASGSVREEAPDPLRELKQELQAIREQLGSAASMEGGTLATAAGRTASHRVVSRGGARPDGIPSWRVGEVLETSGLLPVY